MGGLDLPEETRVIGGLTYVVQPLSARKSLQVMTRVLKMAAPGFGDVASLAQAAGAVGALLEGFAEGLDENVVLFVCESFAEVSKVELAPGKRLPMKDQWDDHFRGKPLDLFAWLRFAAEVSFGPLAEGLKARLASAPATPPAPGAPAPSAVAG